MQNKYIDLLRSRPQVRLLWLAQVVSMLGDWFGTIAAIILVNRYTDSGLAISVLFLARGLPSFLFAPIVGVAADRFNRKRLLVTTDILQTLVGLSFLLVVQFESVILLYVVTTLQFTLAAFFEPARAAILPNLIDTDEELLIANTLTSTTWSFMLAIGAAIGGFTTAVFGVETAIVVNSGTFLLSASLIARIQGTEKPPDDDDDTVPVSGYLDFIDGLRYVTQRPAIGLYTTVKGLSQIGSIDTLFTLYAASVFVVGSEGSVTLGVLYMAFGLGAIIGPVLGNRIGDGSPRFFRRWIGLGFLMIPIGWAAFSFAPLLLLGAVAIVVRAMGNSINWTYSNVQIQLKTPDRYMGRVFALDFSFFTLAYTLAVVLTGFLDDVVQLNPREIALVFSITGLIPTVLWVFAARYLADHSDVEPDQIMTAPVTNP
jgi:MFS family permease